jgi:hypothetical protein
MLATWLASCGLRPDPSAVAAAEAAAARLTAASA